LNPCPPRRSLAVRSSSGVSAGKRLRRRAPRHPGARPAVWFSVVAVALLRERGFVRDRHSPISMQSAACTTSFEPLRREGRRCVLTGEQVKDQLPPRLLVYPDCGNRVKPAPRTPDPDRRDRCPPTVTATTPQPLNVDSPWSPKGSSRSRTATRNPSLAARCWKAYPSFVCRVRPSNTVPRICVVWSPCAISV
jgi:hypothetical protein